MRLVDPHDVRKLQPYSLSDFPNMVQKLNEMIIHAAKNGKVEIEVRRYDFGQFFEENILNEIREMGYRVRTFESTPIHLNDCIKINWEY